MEKPKKMNVLYLIAFILMCVCLVLLVAGIAVAYLLEQPTLSAVFTGGGSVLALTGIILAMLSKPKKQKIKNPEIIDFESSDSSQPQEPQSD